MIKDIHEQLTSATSFAPGKFGINQPKLLTSQTVIKKQPGNLVQQWQFVMSFKELKIEDHCKMSPLSRKPLSENFCNRQYCFLRHSFVNVMDPSTNVIFPERQIKEISLTSTAEVNLILC